MLVRPPSAGGQAPVHNVFAAGAPKFYQTSKGLGRYVENYTDVLQARFRNQHLGSYSQRLLGVLPLCFLSTASDITLPPGFLQAPVYPDVQCFVLNVIAYIMCQMRGTLQSPSSSPSWADVCAAYSDHFPKKDTLWSCQEIPFSSTSPKKNSHHLIWTILVITETHDILPWKTCKAPGSVTFLY